MILAELKAETAITTSAVQLEWDHTVQRLQAVCEITAHSPTVGRGKYMHLQLRRTPGLDLSAVERILFDNLLLAVWSRTEEQERIHFGGQWLFHWRKAVPYQAERVEGISLLPPGTRRNQWTYRFNLIEADC